MLIFTVAKFLIMFDTVIRVQRSEIEYINNITDSIVDNVRSEKSIEKLDLMPYASKSQC